MGETQQALLAALPTALLLPHECLADFFDGGRFAMRRSMLLYSSCFRSSWADLGDKRPGATSKGVLAPKSPVWLRR